MADAARNTNDAGARLVVCIARQFSAKGPTSNTPPATAGPS
ncbi:MAG: hypothetical protein ACFE0O_11465 [Opitutales bacterium]